MKSIAGICVGWWIAVTPVSAAQVYRGVDLYTLMAPTNFSLTLELNQLKAAGGQDAGFARFSASFATHALVWNSNGSVVDLHPAGTAFASSLAAFTNGSQQVGTGLTFLGTENALLWNGSAATAINLQPTNLPNVNESRAVATDGVQQVGVGVMGFHIEHALLWNGSGGSAIDLQPTNLRSIVQSNALSTIGGHQAGFGFTSAGFRHALVWSGTADSAVDLHPTNLSGFASSVAEFTTGLQQVGAGITDGGLENALLWNGSADSAVNLHSDQMGTIVQSHAFSTNGAQQVGVGVTTSGMSHAQLWSGTAASAIDLHLLLPDTFTASTADAIDAQGNVFGSARDVNGLFHAVKWSPVPRGDFSLNGAVDTTDIHAMLTALTNFNAFKSAHGISAAELLAIGDIDHDGNVTNGDLQSLLNLLKSGSGMLVSVPEPASNALMAVTLPGFVFAAYLRRVSWSRYGLEPCQ